jgi:hypothetical protein
MAGNLHPIYRDGEAVDKANARTYTPVRLGNPDALRALDGSTFWLCYIQTLLSFFYRDTSDTTSEDNGSSVIVDGNGGIWKVISSGAGIAIDAAGPLADRGEFDSEDPGFTYFGTDTELLYVRETSGGWSDGTELTGPQGEPGNDGADGRNFQPDEVVPDLAGRDAYDVEAKNFAVLVESDSSNDDLPTLYFKLSATSGDWSAGSTFGSGGGDVAGDTHAATSKTTPVDADELPLVDSEASNVLKKLTWANLKATLGGPANLCLNPGMQVWQNDTTLVNAGHRYVLADGWLLGGLAGTFTTSRSTDVPDDSVQYSIKVACSSADASPADDAERHIRWAIFGCDLAPYISTDLTIKFWVKSNKVGTYCVNGDNENRDRSFVREYTINAANTWEEKTVTIPLSTKTGTWNAGRGYGIGFRFVFAAGANYQTTKDAWQTGNYSGTSNQTYLGDNTANEFYLTKVQITPGAPGAFALPPYEDALRNAHRQYRVYDCDTGGVNLALGLAPTADSVNFDFPLAVPMMAPVTSSIKGALNSDILIYPYNGSAVLADSLTSFARSKDVAKFSANKTGGYTAGQTYIFRLNTTSGKLVVDGHLG